MEIIASSNPVLPELAQQCFESFDNWFLCRDDIFGISSNLSPEMFPARGLLQAFGEGMLVMASGLPPLVLELPKSNSTRAQRNSRRRVTRKLIGGPIEDLTILNRVRSSGPQRGDDHSRVDQIILDLRSRPEPSQIDRESSGDVLEPRLRPIFVSWPLAIQVRIPETSHRRSGTRCSPCKDSGVHAEFRSGGFDSTDSREEDPQQDHVRAPFFTLAEQVAHRHVCPPGSR